MKLNSDIQNKLRDFGSWNEGKSKQDQINLFDYATFKATPDLILSFSQLLNPEIVEYKGSYLFNRGNFNPQIYDDWEASGLRSVEIEKIMNHVHMSLILQDQDDLEDDVVRACAEVIAFFWTKMLGDKGIIGEVIEGDIYDMAVTFYSKKD